MPKKNNDIDTAMIERAAYFSATIFVGNGNFRTEELPTLEAAREAAIRFKAEVNNGRRGMVYAVTAEGRSALVPDHYQPSSKGEPEMPTNLSSTQIAQLSAILTGGGMKRANSKEAAIKRFANIAVLAGFGEPAIRHTLKQATFAEAESYVMAVLREQRQEKEDAEAQPKRVRASDADLIKIEQRGGEHAAAATAELDRREAARKPATGKRAAILEAAQRGELPAAPDFTAETHKRFRPKLAAVVAMAEAGDLAGLKAIEINPISSSPKAIAKYRDLCVIALRGDGSSV